MTRTLTTDELRQIVDSHEKGYGMSVPINYGYLAARELLANREAQPVAEVVSKYGDPEAFGEREIRVLADADLQKIPYDTKLFTAPPAVPHVTVIPEAATLTNINQLCPLDNNLSQTDFATGWNDCRQYALTHDGVPPVIKGVHAAAKGWNACLAAMLAQPVSQGCNWIACSERMPEPNKYVQVSNGVWVGIGMYNDAEHFEDDERWQDEHNEFIDLLHHPVTHWMPLPAAPEGGNDPDTRR